MAVSAATVILSSLLGVVLLLPLTSGGSKLVVLKFTMTDLKMLCGKTLTTIDLSATLVGLPILTC